MSIKEFPHLNKQSKPDKKGWISGCCPIHNEKNPSFSYDPDTGGWICHSSCGSGNYEKFLELYDPSELDRYRESKKKKRSPVKKTKKKSPAPKKPPTIKESYVKKCQDYLSKIEAKQKWLLDNRGITSTTIKEHEIGWDPEVQRYTLPVRDHRGKLVNIRRYSPDPKQKRFRMMPYIQKDKDGDEHTYGENRLYGLDRLVNYKGDEVIVCEGEWDRLLLVQNGFFAVTGTAGCQSFKPEWLQYFKDKDVVLIYDCDNKGQMGAIGKVLHLFESADIRSIKNILLPLEGTEEDNDITDYFHQNGLQPQDLRKLITESERHLYDRDKEGEKEPIIVLESFLEIEQKQYIDKRIQCEIVVSGETTESFHAVEKFVVDYCKQKKDGKCVECLLPINIPKNAEEYIGSCMSTKNMVIGMLRAFACKFEQRPRVKIIEKTPVKEFFCHQVIKRDKSGVKKQELLEKRCYYISSNNVNPGHYLATGYVKTHPKTQAITFLIEEMVPQDDDYQSFNLEKSMDNLLAFQKFKLSEIIKDLTNNVTNIYKRDELLVAVLLTFFSPLYIRFNKIAIRGWMLSIIIGDSGLGKTQTYNRISDYIGAGDFFSCLTGSRTGLAYAMVDTGNKGWQVKIGRYPANSGKLLAVDEVQHLEEFDLQAISKAMDEGFMQIDKVKSRGYDSRTRLLMMCNPKFDRVMDEHMYGCEALKTIFPPTILRRVDLAVFANSGDMIDYSLMNKKTSVNPKISPEMLRAALFWVWNLKQDETRFDPKAEDLCLSQAQILSNEFGNAVDVPLVAPSDFRFNLARMSAAFAALDLSTEDFRGLIVKEKHVKTAVNFIKKVYRHQSCSLNEYSKNVKLKTHLLDYDKLEAAFIKKKEAAKFSHNEAYFVKAVYQFKTNLRIRRDDLKDFVGCSIDTAKKYVSFLKACHLIKATTKGYQKQPKMVKFLRELERKHPDFFADAEAISYDDPEDDDLPDYLK